MAPHARSAHLKDHVMIGAEDSPDGRLSVLGVPMGQGNLPIVEMTRQLLAIGLDRIAFENVWPYRAAVAASRPGETGDDIPDTGVFARARPPFHESRCLLAPEKLLEREPQRLVELEDRAVGDGLRWLRGQFEAAGIEMATAT